MCKTRSRHRGRDKSETLNRRKETTRREDLLPKISDKSNKPNETIFMFPRINDSSDEGFAITSKLQKDFISEDIINIFPFKSSHGIYFIRTVKRSYKGNKKDTVKLRLVIADIKHNCHFSNRNGCDGEGIPKETILLSTGTEVSYDKLMYFTSEECVENMMKEFSAQDNELVQGIKRNITLSNIQVLIEYLSKLEEVEGNISKITYYERMFNINEIRIINVIPEEYFYDFLRSRLDDSEISFESFMRDLRETKSKENINLKRRVC